MQQETGPVTIIRGQKATAAADMDVSDDVLRTTAETGVPAVRVWRPHRQVTFGRRDAQMEGYETAREIARTKGFTPLERGVGGRAVAYSGRTVAFGRFEPIDDTAFGLERRFEATMSDVQAALRELGARVTRGEPSDAFCPGSHSLRGDGKLVGLAQRVRKNVALVSGIIVVRDGTVIADVLAPVYGALGVPFDPASIGSVAEAGGPDDPDVVARSIENALLDGRNATVVDVTSFRESTPSG